jgi:hypothetical protein
LPSAIDRKIESDSISKVQRSSVGRHRGPTSRDQVHNKCVVHFGVVLVAEPVNDRENLHRADLYGSIIRPIISRAVYELVQPQRACSLRCHTDYKEYSEGLLRHDVCSVTTYCEPIGSCRSALHTQVTREAHMCMAVTGPSRMSGLLSVPCRTAPMQGWRL